MTPTLGMYFSRLVLAGAAALALAACASPRKVGGALDEIPLSFAPPNIQPSRMEPGIFVFNDPQSIRVKVRRQSLLSIIDEVAYRQGFNYRIVSDLTPYQVDVHGSAGTAMPGEESLTDWERTSQREFVDARELFDHLNKAVTDRYLQPRKLSLGYRWLSDGPEFYLFRTEEPARIVCSERVELGVSCDPAQITFKKFFIRNVVVEEALKSIRLLFFKDEPEPSKSDQPPPAQINKDNAANATMVLYKPQNAIVVRSTDQSLFDKISQSLYALDASYQQVLVETLIFQYDDSIAKRIGAELDWLKKNGNSSYQITSKFGEGITSALPQIFHTLTDTEKRATLLTKFAFYDRDGLVRILAEPRLVLQSGEAASVALETNKFVITPGVNTSGDVREIKSGIDFKVTPTVLGNGKVRLSLELKQSEFVPTNETSVVLSKNENKVVTSIIANDGEMVSIGGIHSRRDSKFGSGIPYAREIPTLGHLFGSTATDSSTSRIEFMIRPTVERASLKLRNIQGNIEKTNLMIRREIGGDDVKHAP